MTLSLTASSSYQRFQQSNIYTLRIMRRERQSGWQFELLLYRVTGKVFISTPVHTGGAGLRAGGGVSAGRDREITD